MKRKMKKFNEGGKTYEQEDEGILGGKVNYREEDGRKYVAGKANPFDRNPAEQRYYSMDDVKGKLSGLFGSDKKEAKYDDSKSVGDANKSSSYNKAEEGPSRQMTDRMINKPEPAGKTYLREEADIDYKSPKKAAPKKAAPVAKDAEGVRKAANDSLKEAAPAPKKAKVEEAKKPTPLPAKAADKKPLGKASQDYGIPLRPRYSDLGEKDTGEKKGFSTKMGKTNEEREAQAKANREALSESVSGISKYFRNPFTEEREYKKDKPFTRNLNAKPTADQMKKMAKGGTVKSASARADGCAIRGKTRA